MSGTVPAAEGGFLQRTLAASFEPGTNRKGDVLGGAWTLLLDSLELGRVVCLGMPAPRTLRTLVRRGDGVTVVCAGAQEAHRARAAAPPDAHVIEIAGVREMVGHVDLAVVTSEEWARRADREPALGDLVRGAHTVFAQIDTPQASEATRPLWLGVQGDEVHLAASADDDATIALLRRPSAALRPGRGMAKVRARAKALARRVRRAERVHERHAVISVHGVAPTAQPAWLRRIAAASGACIDDCRVGLVAAPDYPSRKAILFLRPDDAPTPRYVVKMPRDAAFNDRLENEWRALSLLAAARIGDDETVPRPAFFGHHAGLAVLGQTTIAGAPFRQKTSGTASCRLAWRGIGWLEALGVRTATTSVAANGEIAAGLHRLLGRYSAIYKPSGEERAALGGFIDRIGTCERPLPLVFQHGDPGTWNLLITADGRPAFLDWEAAEPHGMPLWDLYYFMRSFGIGVAGATGGNTLKAFADQFLFDTPVSRGLAELVERHCVRVGIDRGLAESLFFTCWMHRALKESMRLGPDDVGGGRYVKLLRLCLARRDAPALRRVFDGR
jgi:hypothetical protein